MKYFLSLLALMAASNANAETYAIRDGTNQAEVSSYSVTVQQTTLGSMTLNSLPTDIRVSPCAPKNEIQHIPLIVQCIRVFTGEVDPQCTINLDLSVGNDDGEHAHGTDDERPKGTLSRTTGLGEFQFTYDVPDISGQVKIRATGTDPLGNPITPFTWFINVGTTGLVELPEGDDYDRVGTSSHPGRYYGTPALLAALQSLATKYHTVFPGDPVLGFNDMNLRLGGLFDYQDTWRTPHCGHRGTNADVRTKELPQGNREVLKALIGDVGLSLHDETINNPLNPHYHVGK